MKRLCLFLLCPMLMMACSYDESLTLCELRVQLAYEQTTFGEPQSARVRVELKDQNAQIFVDSTSMDRSTSAFYVDSTGDTWWRYVFNGIRSQIVVSPDSLNQVEMQVKVTRKRVVH